MVERAARVVNQLVQWFRAVPTWERRLHALIVRASPTWLTSGLTTIDAVYTDERAAKLVALALVPWFPVWAAAVWATPVVEEWLKQLARRGRPRDETEWGLPSGDAMLAVVFWGWMGWWATPIVVTTCFARLVRGAHWPLDVVAGVAVGLLLLGVLL